MAPPGSGLAFESWPDSFEGSDCFRRPDAVENGASHFLEEDWSCCIGKKGTGVGGCTATASSPQKSGGSPATKTLSSISTHVENGQKEEHAVSTKNGSSSQPNGDNDGKDEDEGGNKHDGSNDPSELTHESQQNEMDQQQNGDIGGQDDDDANGKEGGSNDSSELTHGSGRNKGKKDGAKPEESQSSSAEERGKKSGKDSEGPGEGQPDQNGGGRVSDNGKKKGCGREMDAEGNEKATDTPQQSDVIRGISDKYRLFEASSIHLERAMTAPATTKASSSSQYRRGSEGGGMSSNLTLCAESLARSYMSASEFAHNSEECENDIESMTSEMEGVLDRMFPARGGRKSSAVACDDGEDCQRRIEELMSLRKEAVSAKLALLMTPKR